MCVEKSINAHHLVLTAFQPPRLMTTCLQVGDDAAALRILAIELQDMVAAEQYCAEHQSQDGQATYAVLMDMLLHPGSQRKPLLAQACHLLAAQGRFFCSQLTAVSGGPLCANAPGKLQ